MRSHKVSLFKAQMNPNVFLAAATSFRISKTHQNKCYFSQESLIWNSFTKWLAINPEVSSIRKASHFFFTFTQLIQLHIPVLSVLLTEFQFCRCIWQGAECDIDQISRTITDTGLCTTFNGQVDKLIRTDKTGKKTPSVEFLCQHLLI